MNQNTYNILSSRSDINFSSADWSQHQTAGSVSRMTRVGSISGSNDIPPVYHSHDPYGATAPQSNNAAAAMRNNRPHAPQNNNPKGLDAFSHRDPMSVQPHHPTPSMSPAGYHPDPYPADMNGQVRLGAVSGDPQFHRPSPPSFDPRQPQSQYYRQQHPQQTPSNCSASHASGNSTSLSSFLRNHNNSHHHHQQHQFEMGANSHTSNQNYPRHPPITTHNRNSGNEGGSPFLSANVHSLPPFYSPLIPPVATGENPTADNVVKPRGARLPDYQHDPRPEDHYNDPVPAIISVADSNVGPHFMHQSPYSSYASEQQSMMGLIEGATLMRASNTNSPPPPLPVRPNYRRQISLSPSQPSVELRTDSSNFITFENIHFESTASATPETKGNTVAPFQRSIKKGSITSIASTPAIKTDSPLPKKIRQNSDSVASHIGLFEPLEQSRSELAWSKAHTPPVTPNECSISARPAKFAVDSAMPHHGNNVHSEGLRGIAEYQAYGPSHRYTHDPYAQRYTMRASCLPFEREATMVSDMQTVLNTICDTTSLPAIVESAQKAPRGHTVEFILRTSDPHQLSKILAEAVVLMDRHGFHYVLGRVYERKPASSLLPVPTPSFPSLQTSVTDGSLLSSREEGGPVKSNASTQPIDIQLPSEPIQSSRTDSVSSTSSSSREVDPYFAAQTQKVQDYCESVRRLPLKERHWRLDGLPSSIIRFQLETTPRVFDGSLSRRPKSPSTDSSIRHPTSSENL